MFHKNVVARQNSNGTVSDLESSPNTGSTPDGGSFSESPMLQWFTVTGILGFVALVCLVIYCVISYFETRRRLQLERRSHALLAIWSSGSLSMLSGSTSTSKCESKSVKVKIGLRKP